MNPGRPLTRRKAPARVSVKRRASATAFRKAVLERDAICRMCGQAPSTDPHHILPRGRGGSDDPENGAGLCRPCHDYMTHTVEGQREARRRGLTVGKELPG